MAFIFITLNMIQLLRKGYGLMSFIPLLIISGWSVFGKLKGYETNQRFDEFMGVVMIILVASTTWIESRLPEK